METEETEHNSVTKKENVIDEIEFLNQDINLKNEFY